MGKAENDRTEAGRVKASRACFKRNHSFPAFHQQAEGETEHGNVAFFAV
jgi:hypothetical protein